LREPVRNDPGDLEGRAPLLETHAAPLGAAFDLLAAFGDVYFERGGIGVAGAGRVRAFAGAELDELAQTVRVLRTSARRGRGPAPIAIGAIGFEGNATIADQLIVPARVVRRTSAQATWRLDTRELDGSHEDVPPFEPLVGSAPHAPFSEIQLTEVPTPVAYEAAVAEAVRRIRAGELNKVVLARTVEVEAGRTLDPRLLAMRLRAVDPDAYTFAAPTNDGVIVGASPELLVSRRGVEVRSNPLAGSAPRSGDPEEDRANADALIGSSKDREEHAIVVEAVAETLGPLCEELAWDPEPVLRETPNVWHLSTRFRGRLREPAPTALDLVAELHPTPAVAGAPRRRALELIDELEPFERGRYAGPVGWVDANGDGEWAIALRCAELIGERAILSAGAGIVAGSVPERELDETERKFRAFLDSLRWG
jgi:isochorismate synthase